MLLLDRYIIARFLSNFLLLFLLLLRLAVAIDVMLNLDKFVDAARSLADPDSGGWTFAGKLAQLTLDFQIPKVFQFYAYLHGLTAVGAMAFTLAQMHRYRELVAVMASGVSLYRIAMPFFFGVFLLSLMQLLNQELILPRLAPVLLRDYPQIGQKGVQSFEVRFTPDGKGHLFQAASYDPESMTMHWPMILERDEKGRTVRRITASEATWSEARHGWTLKGGAAIRPRPSEEAAPQDVLESQRVEHYATDLSPQVLMVRRFDQFASMLSLNQISQMLAMPAVPARDSLLRYRYSRFSSVLVNLLILALALPTFLLREPANLLRQSLLCASLAIPATIGAAIGMMVNMPGIPPAVGVFLPVIVLGFMSLFPWTFFKT